jgi:hypothetical protein
MTHKKLSTKYFKLLLVGATMAIALLLAIPQAREPPRVPQTFTWRWPLRVPQTPVVKDLPMIRPAAPIQRDGRKPLLRNTPASLPASRFRQVAQHLPPWIY